MLCFPACYLPPTRRCPAYPCHVICSTNPLSVNIIVPQTLLSFSFRTPSTSIPVYCGATTGKITHFWVEWQENVFRKKWKRSLRIGLFVVAHVLKTKEVLIPDRLSHIRACWIPRSYFSGTDSSVQTSSRYLDFLVLLGFSWDWKFHGLKPL